MPKITKLLKKKLFYFLIIIFGIIFSLFNNDKLIKNPKNINNNILKIVKVIDGDTIELNNGKRVRYIGIDTPEINNRKNPDCYGKEAKEFNKNLVLNKKVRLEKDVSESDKYKRLLRYVYVINESTTSAIFINEELVKNGYAVVSTYPPDIKHVDSFLKAQEYARKNNLGLWSKCKLL